MHAHVEYEFPCVQSEWENPIPGVYRAAEVSITLLLSWGLFGSDVPLTDNRLERLLPLDDVALHFYFRF